MKRKLELNKVTLKTLSSESLEQVAGGTDNGTLDACDALNPLCGAQRRPPIYPLPIYPSQGY